MIRTRHGMDIESGHIDHPFILVDESLLRASGREKDEKPVDGASGGGKYDDPVGLESRLSAGPSDCRSLLSFLR